MGDINLYTNQSLSTPNLLPLHKHKWKFGNIYIENSCYTSEDAGSETEKQDLLFPFYQF